MKPSETANVRRPSGYSGCTSVWGRVELRRGLDIDVLECPDCGDRLRFVAAIMVSPQTRPNSRLREHPPSSATPGLVDRARLGGRAMGPVRSFGLGRGVCSLLVRIG